MYRVFEKGKIVLEVGQDIKIAVVVKDGNRRSVGTYAEDKLHNRIFKALKCGGEGYEYRAVRQSNLWRGTEL